MSDQTFDRYSDAYEETVQSSIAFAHQAPGFFTELKASQILDWLTRAGFNLQTSRVLDLGCGVGNTDRFLKAALPLLEGVDTSRESIQRATQLHPEVSYHHYDGGRLPFEDRRFDAIFAICVIHHVRPEAWSAFIRELQRVLRPGGQALIFEHNPINPLTRLAVSRCAFDKDAVLLSPSRVNRLFREAGMPVRSSRYIVFFPWRGRLWRAVERLIGWLPFGAQYRVVAENPK